MAAYFITWNPKEYSWDELPAIVSTTALGKTYSSDWSTGRSKSIVKGDRLYLLRQGVEPKGIIGSGWASSDCYQADHWDEAKAALGEKSFRVDVDFDRVLDLETLFPLFPDAFVSGPLSKVYKQPSASGFRIPHVVAIDLEQAWKDHLNSISHEIDRSPEKAKRNPPWQRDELILVLDLYIRHGGKDLGANHPEIIELSRLLNKLPIHQGIRKGVAFRNPNGVKMKLMNLRRFDPSQTGDGLGRGNKLEEEVWVLYAGDPERLREVAEAIRAGSKILEVEDLDMADEDEDGCPEGKVLYRLHKTRERDQSVIEKAKKLAIARHKLLACAVCRFDFSKTYGKLGDGFIEGHHTKPVSTLPEDGKTKVKDIALVCGNCHRMIHRKRPWLTVEALASIYQGFQELDRQG